MPVKPQPAKSSAQANTAEGFIGSVFKYSISTVVNMGILGLSMVLTALFIPPAVNGQATIFIQWSNTIMTIAIFGLDQAFFRFYNEAPAGLSQKGLFRICFYFSSAVLLVAGVVCSTVLLQPIYSALQFSMVGPFAVPLLFLNAFFYLIARYFNALFRMEGNILLYTIESILIQFFFKLFYILGAFFGLENPVPAMVLCSVGGMGAFALVFSLMRRDALRPRLAEFTSGGYKTVLPYGAAIAPTAIIVTLNGSMAIPLITRALGETPAGIYSMAYSLSNIVSMVQLGFASFWGPYMFANYKTQQNRIKRVHNYLNLLVLVFFAALVGLEDIIFLIFQKYAAAQSIFPLMMLSAVFTILCETTVYGNAIARKPIFDTLGFALSFATNITGLLLLTGPFQLYGAAIALVLANAAMFLLRTFTAQRQYQSIATPGKTVAAVCLAVLLAVAGTVYAHHFVAKLICSLVVAAAFCALYPKELVRLVSLGFSMLKKLFRR